MAAPPPCPSDVTERSALTEADDGCDRPTADQRALAEYGFASWRDLAAAHASRIRGVLDALPTLADPDAQRLLTATLKFLEAPWFGHAVECGWSMPELFGADAHAPKVRVEHLGLVPYLTWSPVRGVKLEAISADGYVTRTASGSRLCGRRVPYHAARQVLWWQVPSLTREGEAHAA
jgi:hypothetical protein